MHLLVYLYGFCTILVFAPLFSSPIFVAIVCAGALLLFVYVGFVC